MSASTVPPEANDPPLRETNKRGCLFYLGRGLLGFVIVVAALVILGVAFQTIATEQDKRTYSPRGELYDVNGHQMHIVCKGEGSPAVILQAGLSAESLWWYRVQEQLAQHTKVCAYDRPGMGWSEETGAPHDALTIASDLHALIEAAGIEAPYVMAGHSYGAIWSRIYAALYPDEVAGLTLVDSGLVTPEQFASQSEFDDWKRSNDAIQAILWAMQRTGLKRLTAAGDFQGAGYPAEIVPELAALQSPNRTFDATYADQIPSYQVLAEASADAKDLGDLPLIVLWAGDTNTMMEMIPALRTLHDEIPTYSTDSETRVIDGAGHGSILGNEAYAQQVSDAILDVVEAARTGEPLAQPTG
jgi:pimeloyl-ACP methyl ester carboxylesterase